MSSCPCWPRLFPAVLEERVSFCLDFDFTSNWDASTTSHSHMASPRPPLPWGRLAPVCTTVDKLQGGLAPVCATVDKLQGRLAPVCTTVDKLQGGLAPVCTTVDKLQGGLAPVGAMVGSQCALPDPPQVMDMSCGHFLVCALCGCGRGPWGLEPGEDLPGPGIPTSQGWAEGCAVCAP
ncbi:hypothetical protein P7K49_032382 [Saguinus oedipus]|uniref:Uncharacterized protein n=1 Tax=Saguinus oedipus TaxID=9490 RepID=A0ABQ9TY42_SAGOE|nr:hypothetical protein P7K49_032382 [Saguinus oedipus]